MNNFKPIMYQKSIFDINYAKLKKKNIEIIVMDLDNTIAKVDEIVPSDKVKDLFQKLAKDFKIVVASNNFKGRVKKMCENLPCDYFYRLFKPSKRLKKLLVERYQIAMDNVCIIGDQIITDIYLGNKIGALTILVDPIGEKDLKITSLNRFIEKKIKKKMKFKKGDYYEEGQIL